MLFPRVEESLGQVGHLAGQEGPLLVTIRRVLVQIQQSHLTMSLQHGLENILIGLLIKPRFLLLAEPEPGERSDWCWSHDWNVGYNLQPTILQ